MEISKEDY